MAHCRSPAEEEVEVDAPPPEGILAGTSMQSNPVLSDLIALKPEMPLGPQDVLKSYEIAMSMVADKTSADFVVIVQSQQTNQITRQQAEYLLQQRYQTAMMQYQVLSALHDVLKHDIDEASQQGAQFAENGKLRYGSRGSISGIRLCIQMKSKFQIAGVAGNFPCFAGDRGART